MIKENRKKIGEQIMSIRQAKGITQLELANATGLDRANISKIERGKYNVGIDIIQKICDALGTKLVIVE